MKRPWADTCKPAYITRITLPLAMMQLDLGPSHIDIGKLATQFMQETAQNGLSSLPMSMCEGPKSSYCYGRALYNQSVIQIMKTHRYVRQVAHNELSEFETYPIIEALSQLDLGPSHIDVGKLATQYMQETGSSCDRASMIG